MKRFSPYTKYSMNEEIRYSSVGPDGKKEDSANLVDERILKIRSMFPPRFRFRKHQEEIMRLILSGRDTFVVLPTGSGKSLCFQAPSVFFPGITMVITPLVALIENQVNNFNSGHYPRYHSARGSASQASFYENIWFKAIYPGMDGLSPQAMFSEIQHPQQERAEKRQIQYKLLYVSPERLRDQKFLRALREAEREGLQIPHVVVDEVHCMSQWGFDFRESYLYIAGFISERPVRPITSAFTATATPKDRAEIKNLLRFPMKEEDYDKEKYAERIFVEPRGNLSFSVERCSDYDRGNDADPETAGYSALKTRKERLIEILTENPTKVCIIYRTTVAGVEELYDFLGADQRLKDRLVKYHGQMPGKERSDSKTAFLKSYDETAEPNRKARSLGTPCKNILIATKAFGMGIDKDDISLIIHYDMPRSLEDYYQEAGRAGRNREKVPVAMCHLLYAAGPQKEKGTLQYMIQWVLSENGTSASGCEPVSSQFSDEMRKYTYFWSYYRLCYMRRYCEYALRYPHAAQSFIIRYLDNRFTLRQAVREWKSFFRYIMRQCPVSDAWKERFRTEPLFTGNEAYGFLGFCFGAAKQQQDTYHRELQRLMDEVNELHINNTYVANLLRDHPEKYQVNEPYSSEDDPDCGLAQRELTFTIHGSGKLTYFDMCVLDAIYSIELSRKKAVYVQTIWEVLTGRNPRYSSQEKATIREEIGNSIDKMRSMALSLCDRQCGFVVENQCFLPLKDKPQGQKGYSYQTVPPLFQYAEEKNGQIIRVPVSLLNVERVKKSALWKEDFRADCGGAQKESLDGNSRHAFDYHVKYLPQDVAYEPKLKELLGERAYGKLENVRQRPYRFSPSLSNVLLCHYLIRRIAISKKRKRGNFIQFSTIREITGIRDDACLFHKKVAAIMDHYQGTGYLYQFGLYITGYPYQLTNGEAVTDAAYFQVQPMDVTKYWKLHGMNHLWLSDFLTGWSSEWGEAPAGSIGEGGSLSADTKRQLALVPLERMDGIVLRHEFATALRQKM